MDIALLGIVYGYDKPYPTSRLWENFTADMCEDLAGKPKMFFIQVRLIFFRKYKL